MFICVLQHCKGGFGQIGRWFRFWTIYPNYQTTLLRLYTNQLDGVDVVALEALPDADLGFVCAAPEADDVAGGVREGGDLAVVRQDGVGARAGQQVPHADHPVLQIDKISFV